MLKANFATRRFGTMTKTFYVPTKHSWKRNSFTIETFTDPQEALSKYKPGLYDLVILDIRMPRFNGLQFYYKLKSIDNDVKVILLSAFDEAEEIMSIFPTLL
jgi:DNA-binding response OmpR family regulator